MIDWKKILRKKRNFSAATMRASEMREAAPQEQATAFLLQKAPKGFLQGRISGQKSSVSKKRDGHILPRPKRVFTDLHSGRLRMHSSWCFARKRWAPKTSKSLIYLMFPLALFPNFLPCSLYAEIKGITCTTPHHDFGAFYMISLYDLMTPKGASLVAQW